MRAKLLPTATAILGVSLLLGADGFSVPLKLSDVSTVFSPSVPQLFSSHYDKSTLPANAAILTYLEINGWLLTSEGVTILIDPILEGPLDFGIPVIYKASKRVLPPRGLCESLPPIDCILITQGLDDHAHERTLTKLAKLDKSVPVVAPPSARAALEKSGFLSESVNGNIRFIRPGEDAVITSRSQDVNVKGANAGIKIRATTGALVGPPWQARENGYIIRPASNKSNAPSIYIEPHVEFDVDELAWLAREKPVDAVITPISGQGFGPAFELVHGPRDALRLVKTLRPKYVLPMQNGDVDAEGLASSLVQSVGAPEDFRRKLEINSIGDRNVELLRVVPGEDIQLTGDGVRRD